MRQHESEWFHFVASRLNYCSETGLFTWSQRVCTKIKVGDLAGYKMQCGYIAINTYGRAYLAHRLAHFIMTGRVPECIDHINGVRDDNRWCNLRECTMAENQYNRRTGKNNKTGVNGVSISPAGKYRVQIRINRRPMWLGDFDTIDEAAKVRAAAEIKYHGKFASHLCVNASSAEV